MSNCLTNDDATLWRAYSAAVEAIEPGASRHCCLRTWHPDGTHIVSYTHLRLGVRVAVTS